MLYLDQKRHRYVDLTRSVTPKREIVSKLLEHHSRADLARSVTLKREGARSFLLMFSRRYLVATDSIFKIKNVEHLF